MKTYLDVLGEIGIIGWILPALMLSVPYFIVFYMPEKDFKFAINLSGIFVIVSVGFINFTVAYPDMNDYNQNYITCHKQEAIKAGYKMVDKQCYKPYGGLVPVNTDIK